MDKQDIKLSSVIQLYLMYGEDRNFSPKTVRWYSDTPAPDFTLPSIDGSDVTLSSFRGQPVVLVFLRGFG